MLWEISPLGMAAPTGSSRRISAREAVTYVCTCLRDAGVPSVSPEVLRRAKRREAADAGMVCRCDVPGAVLPLSDLTSDTLQHESMWSALVELSVAMRRGLDWLVDGGSAPTAASRLSGSWRHSSTNILLGGPF